MKKILKLMIAAVSSFLVGAGIGLGVIYSVAVSTYATSIGEFDEITNVTTALSPTQTQAIHKSRASVVRVVSLSADQQIFSSATGTYITVGGRYFVLTVSHGIHGPCELTRIEASEEYAGCLKVIEKNEGIDYTIIEIEKLSNRTPVKVPRDLAKRRSDFAIMNEVYYTGYPNSAGPLTIDGKIVGYMGTDFIYIKSYAWSGSSGSGVFSSTGKLIGYILALDVGYTEYGIDVLEDIVFVVPITAVNWDSLLRE